MDSCNLSARLQTDPPGVVDAPSSPDPHIVIHVGPSVAIECQRGGHTHRGVAVHGDIDIVPAYTPSKWTLREKDTALIVRVSRTTLAEAALQSGVDPANALLLNRFQVRDPQIEQLAWALKAEMDSHYESGALYLDSLGNALASRLVHRHSSALRANTSQSKGGLTGAKLRELLAFIEDNLGSELSLRQIAAVSGLSVSHCQRVFRQSVGVSIHRHIIRRRVDRAETLLAQEKLSVAEIALEVGFLIKAIWRPICAACAASLPRTGAESLDDIIELSRICFWRSEPARRVPVASAILAL
jgi:AraC family transcriptional regulator